MTTSSPARAALTRLGERAWFELARAALDLPASTVQRLTRGNPTPPFGVEVEPSMAMVVAAQRWEGQRRLAEPRDVARARRRMRRNTVGLQGTPTPVGTVRAFSIHGPAGDVPVRHYSPPDRGEARPLLVFFHGGGFALGDLDTHDEPCRLLCHHADMHVLSVDYRLAPEHPFPAGLEDAQAAYAWARERAAGLRADPGLVCVGGDSAGANLATVVCQLAPASGVVSPSAQLLIYPPTDHFGSYRSRDLFSSGYLLTEADVEWFHEAYSGTLDRTDDPRRSPLLATNLDAQPPALVVTAELDPLRDEGLAYAVALTAAGVRVERRVAPGMLHGFFSMTTISRAARAEAVQICTDFRALLDDLGGPS